MPFGRIKPKAGQFPYFPNESEPTRLGMGTRYSPRARVCCAKSHKTERRQANEGRKFSHIQGQCCPTEFFSGFQEE